MRFIEQRGASLADRLAPNVEATAGGEHAPPVHAGRSTATGFVDPNVVRLITNANSGMMGVRAMPAVETFSTLPPIPDRFSSPSYLVEPVPSTPGLPPSGTERFDNMTDDSTRQVPVQPLLARVHQLLGNDLRLTEEAYDRELASRHPFIREVLEHLTNYRGKRLRPILLLLAAKACGDIDTSHHVLAAVVEMIHTATLVHDDVLDDATTRRHVATVNSRWTNETSVLLGDYLFTHAFHLTSSLGDARACRLIGRATNLVCAGEMTQVGERGNLDLTEEQYFDIIEGKTAELTAVSCELGAQFSGATPTMIAALERYGRALGMAFQIADDLLDVLGNEQLTGKSLGSDLAKQKLTLPVIHMLANLPADKGREAREVVAQADARRRGELAAWLEETGSISYARNRAVEFVVAGKQELAHLPESQARSLLEDIADFALRRSA
jgi:octaprenyl-diphosphate synthase